MPKSVVRIPGRCGGEPVLEGTRITVAGVRRWIVGGYTTERIMLAYPDLHAEDIDQFRGL